MYLLDSNILIYTAKPEYAFLRSYITTIDSVAAVSVVTVIEVLGFHLLSENDKQYFKACFDLLAVIDLSQNIADKAVELR